MRRGEDTHRWAPWRRLGLRVPMNDRVLGETLDGGQCFRWKKDGEEWTGVIGRQVIRLKPDPAGVRWRQPKGTPDAESALARYLDAEGAHATLRVTCEGELRPALARALVAADVALLRLDKAATRLESIFLELTHGKEAA